ncbi:siderophore ABC transporter substrate-binding protein [Photobacterium atrarenae]|uniref:Siderophore ABC transporter substrate-binding protein n=1 Tax=Photobacterium atrarenae TaxID=865757 RepID=A0ABY5GIQ6_9GAMM|nr:siderophore ABC transporter substrate-binding protein [Photobacterium atrarenae]UTV28818.1 siderophore ABC transporter substrate-binding protein [Photobacterium atrarenae]
MNKIASSVLLSCFISMPALADSVTIEHRMGKTVIDETPKRVVVLGMGALDAVDQFGIDPVAVNKVAQLPAYLQKYKGAEYAAAGSLFEPDFETIYMQKPDLIVAGARAAASYDELSKIAPTIVFAAENDQGYWESTKAQWRNLGKVFDIEAKVEQKIDALDADFKAIRDYNQKHEINALTVMSSGGNITTFGAQSRFSAIYKDFGFKEAVKSIKTSNHGDLISYEYIRKADPQTLLIIDRDKLVNKGESTTRQDFENDLIKATQAYQNNKMTFLDLNAWYISISGVTATEQMIRDMKQSIGI